MIHKSIYIDPKIVQDMHRLCDETGLKISDFVSQSVDYMVKNRHLLNFDRRKPSQPWLTDTQEKHEILEGIMFSDGFIEKCKALPRFSLGQMGSKEEYVRYVAEKFKIEERVKSRSCFDKRTKKTYDRCEFKTLAAKELLSYYHRWYPNGIKIIPDDFKVTPISMMHAFLGDGNYRWKDGSYGISIYTMSFSKTSIEKILLPQIESFGIKCSVDKNNITNIWNMHNCAKFFKYIGPCPVECFKYKWPDIKTLGPDNPLAEVAFNGI